jgi:hypothetical protein
VMSGELEVHCGSSSEVRGQRTGIRGHFSIFCDPCQEIRA